MQVQELAIWINKSPRASSSSIVLPLNPFSSKFKPYTVMAWVPTAVPCSCLWCSGKPPSTSISASYWLLIDVHSPRPRPRERRSQLWRRLLLLRRRRRKRRRSYGWGIRRPDAGCRRTGSTRSTRPSSDDCSSVPASDGMLACMITTQWMSSTA